MILLRIESLENSTFISLCTVEEIASCADIQDILKAFDWKHSIKSVRLKAFDWKHSIESVGLKAFDWKHSIEGVWLKAFNWKRSIESVRLKAFNWKRSIDIGCRKTGNFFHCALVEGEKWKFIWIHLGNVPLGAQEKWHDTTKPSLLYMVKGPRLMSLQTLT